MEREIGEIFKYDGEWFQCVKSIVYCPECAFNQDFCSSKVLRECSAISRFDGNNVIFKKLEKVGKPHRFGKKLMQPYKLFAKPVVPHELGYFAIYSGKNKTIEIEIKQNQKDMARWTDRKEVFQSTDFMDYQPRKGFYCREYF